MDYFRHLPVSARVCLGPWTSFVHHDPKSIGQKGGKTVKAKHNNKLPDSDVPSCSMLSVLDIYAYIHRINAENGLYLYVHRNVLLFCSVYKFGV